MKRLLLLTLALMVITTTAEARHRHKHRHLDGNGNSVSLAGLPQPLADKVKEICDDCGSKVISTFRPGARVRGSRSLSNHALHKAADLKGNPQCIYDHLKGWPGGYSTDYARVKHVHISYNRGKEWGARFAHGGSYRTYHARSHYHHRRYARG